MEIQANAKIHNRFDIEVRNVKTGEITQRGYAENIVLDNYFVTSAINKGPQGHTIGSVIRVGDGIGTLDPSRTELFNLIGSYATITSEDVTVFKNPPEVSYVTKKISILPSELIGKTITEVGIGDYILYSRIFTHALIKDSEGNPLTIGPKTAEEEIIIYRTVYADITLENGVTLLTGYSNSPNYLLRALTMYNLIIDSTVAVANSSTVNFSLSRIGTGKFSGEFTILQTHSSGKVKFIDIRYLVRLDIEELAENDSDIWSGHEFQNKLIGTGDGIITEFALPWDEAWLTKPKKVYVDGLEITSGVTWSGDRIAFDIAPADTLNIAVDYWVKYIPKDTDHEIRAAFYINYGEGTAT